MTRKHFKALATELAGAKPIDTFKPYEYDKAYYFGAITHWKIAVERIADLCGEFNLNFDRARFLKACGYDQA